MTAVSLFRSERALLVAVLAGVAGFYFEHGLLEHGGALLWLGFFVILAVIIAASFRVAHHAEVLAQRFGEPYGTMILTLSAVIVEVVMLAIIIMQTHSPTLARDTIFSAVMLDMNGILGVAAIIGGIRHGEQKYNLDASNSYIAMLLVAIGISMFIPDFLKEDHWRAYSVFSVFVTLVLYGVFLRIQTVEHRSFFQFGAINEDDEHADHGTLATGVHVVVLLCSIVLIGILAEILAALLDRGMVDSGLPMALPAVLVALVSASPEIMTAMRAALKDNMQVVINIALGASLATVLLTVPIIEAIALLTGTRIEMGITPIQAGLLLLTILAAMINLHDGDTNVLEGATHFALFATFVMLVFVNG